MTQWLKAKIHDCARNVLADTARGGTNEGCAARGSVRLFLRRIVRGLPGDRTEWTGNGAFDAEFSCYDVGPGVLARMWAPGHTGRRGPSLVRRHPDEALYLNFSASAEHRVSHLDRDSTVPRGVPVLLDSEAPFVVDFAGRPRFHMFSLRIEKEPGGFAPAAEIVRQVNERIVRTAIGRSWPFRRA